MKDIKILSIKDVLNVISVSLISSNPVSLKITGENFYQATEVNINDMPAKEFMIVNNTTIIAQTSDNHNDLQISKIAVLAEQPSQNRDSLLYFDLGNSFKPISGFEKMIQGFSKLLLQTPGSDIFAPNLGGGVLSIIGSSVSVSTDNSLSSLLVTAVKTAQDQYIALQRNNSKIPPNEKLLSAVVTSVGFDINTTTLAAVISVSAVSGKQAVTNLVL